MKQEDLVELLDKMTLEEKIDQLLQLSAAFYSEEAEEKTGPMSELGLADQNIKNAGSTLGVSGAAESIRIQTEYIKNHRLGIPTILMADIIHGFRTIFPIPLAIGSSWDLAAAKKMAEVSAKEAAVSGLHVTFSPMVDLVRDPRWGRVLETTGEDSYLNGCFAESFVKGYQSENLKENMDSVAACVKHFAAYGAPVAGRDYNTVNMSERELREIYLPGYKKALDAGAKLVMTSFNTIDGVPATGNKWLFREILRKEYGFSGVVISDWGAVKELIPHGVAKNEEEAAELAIKAGVDIEMMTTCYTKFLGPLIKSGRVPEKQLNEAVLRVLELKNDLGLFENPYRGADEKREKEIILSREHRQISKELAQKSIVLLKNDGILPLNKQDIVAIVGPGAKSQDILGAWSWQGKTEEAISLVEGAKNYSSNLLIAHKYCDYFEPSQEAIDEAIELAKRSEKVIVSLGEPEWMSGEAASRSDIRLPKAQIALFEAITKVNPNVIVTMYNGRPLDTRAIDSSRAIVEAWFPGTEGGSALASILWGEYNPSARLSMSFPETVGQVPIYYNVDNTGRPFETTPDEKYSSKYLDVSNYAKYPFGFGLSYHEVEYKNLTLDKSEIMAEQTLKVSVIIKNTTNLSGKETVQLYIRDLVGQVVRPVKELKAFKQIEIAPYEEKMVEFEITERDLRYVHSNQEYVSDSGKFEVMIGPNSNKVLISSFELLK